MRLAFPGKLIFLELLLFGAVLLFCSNHKCKHSEGQARAAVEWQMIHPFLDAVSEKRR